MEQGILLEAGTNELEILVFQLGDTPFGINVAKVREIIQPCKTITIPYAPRAVEGTIRVRDDIFTLVNLGRHFGMSNETMDPANRMIIIVEFNNVRCGILVDEVQRIHRLKWDRIQAPSQYLLDVAAPITGVANIENMVVLIADFETIVGEILAIQSVLVAEDALTSQPTGPQARLLVVDDSSFVRTALIRQLQHRGYENLTVCTDGQQAWETLETHRNDKGGAFDLILSDIEMPRMDGLHLTAKIKQDPQLKHIPVVLFSSLITPDNRKKGESVGADAQISKPNGEEMVQTIESCLAKTRSKPSPCVTA